ncbi:hypothetical protein ACFL0H_13920, partial [Thermodesulfobacteriota bacterium]
MKKNLPKVIGCCFLALLLIISVGNISQAAPKSIKISGVISMTGKMAGNGIQLHETYEIITKKVNAEGGIYVKKYGKKLPVEYRMLDDESDGQKTQTQLEVANSWGALANLGGLGCASFELGTPICQKNKMTWIGPGCGGWAPHTQGNKWLFSVFIKTHNMGPLPFDMIREQPGPKPSKVAIFEINQLDAQEAAGAWKKGMKDDFKLVFHKK